jgi:rubrerythrin
MMTVETATTWEMFESMCESAACCMDFSDFPEATEAEMAVGTVLVRFGDRALVALGEEQWTDGENSEGHVEPGHYFYYDEQLRLGTLMWVCPWCKTSVPESTREFRCPVCQGT